MKRLLAMLLAGIMLMSGGSCAESGLDMSGIEQLLSKRTNEDGSENTLNELPPADSEEILAKLNVDLSSLSPAELQQLIQDAEMQLRMQDGTMVQSAIDALKDHWKNEIYTEEKCPGTNGYFEILFAQAVFIKKDFAMLGDEVPGGTFFENVYCVVDFSILSDYFGSAPYYSMVPCSVRIYRDGSMAPLVNMTILDVYRSRTFNTDYSAIIERIERIDLGEDNVFYLTGE